jgi:hypothetical protein
MFGCCSSRPCISYIVVHPSPRTHFFLDIMTFTMRRPKRTNSQDEEGNPTRQHGTTSGHATSPPTEKKSKVTKSCDRLDICIYKVTDQVGNCWNTFEGTAAPLWQVLAFLFLIAKAHAFCRWVISS